MKKKFETLSRKRDDLIDVFNEMIEGGAERHGVFKAVQEYWNALSAVPGIRKDWKMKEYKKLLNEAEKGFVEGVSGSSGEDALILAAYGLLERSKSLMIGSVENVHHLETLYFYERFKHPKPQVKTVGNVYREIKENGVNSRPFVGKNDGSSH